METILPYILILVVLVLYLVKKAEARRLKRESDGWQRRWNKPFHLSEEKKQQILKLVQEGRKIQAIKELRDETGLGIKEAKDYVDKLNI